MCEQDAPQHSSEKYMAEAVRYRVSMSRPHSHLFEVEALYPPSEGPLTVAMPVWTPGSYLVREFARHVQQMTASSDRGEPLPITRLDKRSLRVESSQGKRVRLRYLVYANELSVRTSHLDGTHGYFNGASTFFYSEAFRDWEHRMTIEAPPGWRAFCALDREGGDLIAPNYDELIDSPVEVGPQTPLEFQVSGVPHQIVLWGEAQLDRPKLLADLAKICETEAQMFDGLPMKRFLFPRFHLPTSKGWEDFLTLVAHEYFHLWNIKRIKPKSLVPFNYGEESYTGLLWAFEGITSYYDNLLVRRAGLMSAARYLARLGEAVTSLHATPGRRVQTLVEASLAAWIKHYRPDENSPNSAISYYLKGDR